MKLNKQKIQTKLKKYIEMNELEELIKILKYLFETLENAKYNNLILLASRYDKIKSISDLNTGNPEGELNTVKLKFLELIDSLDDQQLLDFKLINSTRESIGRLIELLTFRRSKVIEHIKIHFDEEKAIKIINKFSKLQEQQFSALTNGDFVLAHELSFKLFKFLQQQKIGNKTISFEKFRVKEFFAAHKYLPREVKEVKGGEGSDSTIIVVEDIIEM